MNTSIEDWSLSIKEADRMIGDDKTDGTRVYEATLPFRQIASQGESPEAAAGSLLQYYCELSRQGQFNPHRPNDQGVPPIQHVLSILSDMLAENIAGREAHRRFTEEDLRRRSAKTDQLEADFEAALDGKPAKPSEVAAATVSELFEQADSASNYRNDATFKRDNEIIAGLATAIAALSRVKEL